ncbi:MAG: hypothetical protein KGI08_09995 [Thaumarchaeota archaeon]|nr:hypothetical protein [Nitrososphaerota archaeon]
MKKLILTTVTAALLAVSTKAQTTTWDNVLTNFVGATNWAIEPYMTYAPKAPGTKIGGGVLALYGFSPYISAGLGLDWLGQLSLVSGNVTLQAPFHASTIMPAGLVSALHLTNVVLSPFVLGGIATAYSGSGNFNGGISTIEDVGMYVKFAHVLGGQLDTGLAYGQWTGLGPYDVKRYHAFFGIEWGF